jgi:phage anti-repressor protein
MEISKTPVDIKTLIQTSSIQIYDKTKLINKLEEHFSEEEQKLYVSNLFLYLNYHPVDDFVVNLENVWKFIGFANKANWKRLLKQHFIENRDYKISLIRTDERVHNGCKAVIRTDDGKFATETIMLNINTFKKLCLKSNTDNADKIHDYYIKLEMVYNELKQVLLM